MSGGRDDASPSDAASQLPAPTDHDRSSRYGPRLFVAQFLGLVGIVLYNWWVWVVVATNLLISTDEFFSDLEATGRPDATLFQHFDLAAGIVMLVAFLVRGTLGPEGQAQGVALAPPLRGRGRGRRPLRLRLSRGTERRLSQRRVAPAAPAAPLPPRHLGHHRVRRHDDRGLPRLEAHARGRRLGRRAVSRASASRC